LAKYFAKGVLMWNKKEANSFERLDWVLTKIYNDNDHTSGAWILFYDGLEVARKNFNKREKLKPPIIWADNRIATFMQRLDGLKLLKKFRELGAELIMSMILYKKVDNSFIEDFEKLIAKTDEFLGDNDGKKV